VLKRIVKVLVVLLVAGEEEVKVKVKVGEVGEVGEVGVEEVGEVEEDKKIIYLN
jgi:hypothetical protein